MPLFSLRGARDWGIGEFGDLVPFCDWLAAAGHRLLQLLPIGEMARGERSPYAALSAFALDPIYLSLDAVEDFVAAGGETALRADERDRLAAARGDPGIDYDRVRDLKRSALEIAFAHFLATEWRGDSARARALRGFCASEAGWLPEYALFRALQDRHAGPWSSWEQPLRDHAAPAVAEARQALADQQLFHQYVQWLAAEQWAAARRGAAAAGVRLKGDLPFMVGHDSADVWARQREFALDASLGAPPDAFNADGQDWGLPVPRWDTPQAGGQAWLGDRAARAAVLFDAFRLDHVVGFYRTYVMSPGGSRAFVPPEEPNQLILGEKLLQLVLTRAAGTQVIAEDLGVVPDFVRESLTRLGVPGYRVLRWERDAGVFRDPARYPALSVATSGTHDTSPLATWWEEELDPDARRALASVPSFDALREVGDAFTPAVHAALLRGLYAARSTLVVIPFQDAYGGRERINVPATVAPSNWAYRLPWTVTELSAHAQELAHRLCALARDHARLPA